jgi:hypothetical protein
MWQDSHISGIVHSSNCATMNIRIPVTAEWPWNVKERASCQRFKGLTASKHWTRVRQLITHPHSACTQGTSWLPYIDLCYSDAHSVPRYNCFCSMIPFQTQNITFSSLIINGIEGQHEYGRWTRIDYEKCSIFQNIGKRKYLQTDKNHEKYVRACVHSLPKNANNQTI